MIPEMRCTIKNRLCLLALLGIFFGLTGAAAPTVNYTGHYELAETNGDRSFSLDIMQTASGADLSFSTAMADGSGAAPDGDGKGRVDASGVLLFTFKDSFDNEGTGSLQASKGGYLLKMNVSKVVEPRPLRFYGNVLVKKTANKPAP